MTEEELKSELSNIFARHPEALKFTLDYNKYVHLIDDVIDEKPDNERTLKAFQLGCQVYSNPFYVRNASVLGAVDFLVNNSYADSIHWEKSNDDWKRNAADVLRHAGLDMFFATIAIIAGRDALRKISLRMREYTHEKHLTDLISSYGDNK